MRERNLLVDGFAILFGIGAWVAINGLWVELPLLVEKLPEQWSLPSYMSVVTQIANIGPISYTIMRIKRPTLRPVPIIYFILFLGCLSSLLLALFWDRTTYIGGNEHSTALLSLVFFLAFVDCTSSVLYIPYMAAWKNIYLPSYLIGEGLSGLLPAVVALFQGVGSDDECEETGSGSVSSSDSFRESQPNFSIDAFFYFLFAMMVASALAFVTLEMLPIIQNERSRTVDTILTLTPYSSNSNNQSAQPILVPTMPKRTFIFLLLIQSWSSMLSNGLMPSIQSFSCAPYGSTAYHLAATLSALANPLAAFATMILPRSLPKLVGILSFVGTTFACYIFGTATMSPTPPLVDQNGGSALIILMWVAFIGIITYVRVEIANLMREDGASQLFWSGVVTQAGSAVGAIVAFCLVNNTNLFKTYSSCQ